MKKIKYRRSNVRVVFDNPNGEFAKAVLQYKVLCCLFSRWVSVNEIYVNGMFSHLTQLELYDELLRIGCKDKDKRIKLKQFKRIS